MNRLGVGPGALALLIPGGEQRRDTSHGDEWHFEHEDEGGSTQEGDRSEDTVERPELPDTGWGAPGSDHRRGVEATTRFSPPGLLSAGMSVTGLCQICESATADDACHLCGRLVCEKHYAESDELCTVCASEGGGRPSNRQPSPEHDDVDTYEM